MIFCTIYDGARIGALRALVASLRGHLDDTVVLALRVDEAPDPDIPGVQVVGLGALPFSDGWQRIAVTAPLHRDEVLTGPLLALALQRDDRAVYLSTSVRVCADLDPLLSALDDDEIVVVGMVDRPLPSDGCQPERDLVEAAGVANPRIVAVRGGATSERLLTTWPSCADPAPAFAPELTATRVSRHLDRQLGDSSTTTLRNPGLGAAYWNLPLRAVSERDGQVLLDGEPLRLLDLAGLDAQDPAALWPHQDRLQLVDVPPLARLVVAFADELRAMPPEGPAPYLTDAQGRMLDPVLRKLVREALGKGALTAAPWTPEGAEQWEAYLDAPAPVGAAAGITRWYHAIWQSRPDLQEAFPDLDGDGGTGLANWVVTWGPLAGADDASAGPVEARRELPWGVNVAGFFRSELGLGEAARLLITSLDRAKVPALPVHGTYVPPTRQDAEFTYTTPSQAPYPINILCLNGDIIPHFVEEVGPAFLDDRHTIALWWWEVVDAFPAEWHAAFDHLDEVWVATDHIYDAIAPHSPVPVNKVRMPVSVPRIGNYSRTQLGMPEDGFIFLYIFDYHSTAARKNPVGHVEAFKAAFGEGSGAKLVLKCINADRMAAQHTRTLLAIDDHPDITVIDRFVSADEKNAMVAACDCYLSLHRSEGFGLTPAEAMALGKPVIATRYGGTLDFMTDQNSYLVDHGWTTVGPAAHPYPADATWAEPDLDHAARLMREVFDNQAEARRRGEQARRDIRERHDPAVAGAIMRGRLQNLHNGLVRRPGSSLAVPDEWNRHNTALRIATPVGATAGRGRAVKQALRTTVGRLIRPFLDRQRGIDEHLYEGLVYLQDQLDVLPQRAADAAETSLRQERAQTLAAFRRVRAELEDQQRWLTTLDQGLTNTDQRLSGYVADVDHRLARHLDEHRALPFMTEPFERWDEPAAGRVEGFRGAAEVANATGYHAFEQRFRGTRDRIIGLQRPYVDLLRGREPVLDCGCGRGELLELLRDAGITAAGVDLDDGMLAEARRLDLDVTTGDAVELLRAAAAGAYGAVTAMQVIEHLPEAQLIEFLRAARHALRAGGRLIVETVNPHSVVALKGFWLDLSHQHPLFPEVVLELCREAGFDQGFVYHPGGQGDPDVDRYAIPAYAVIADVASR